MSKGHTLLVAISLFLVILMLHFIPKIDNSYKADSQRVISLDSLEARVFEQYGGGDAGVEEMLYLTTGIHQDFMGTPDSSKSIVYNYDYLICLNDSFTVVYDIYGKFVTTVPYIEGSEWDKAMVEVNQ